MTRRLRMASIGLCAFCLPACSMLGWQSDDHLDPATAPASVKMTQPAAAQPGLREQIAAGQYATAPAVPDQPFGPPAAPDRTMMPSVQTGFSVPATELPMPAMPAMPVTVAKNEQPADPIQAQAAMIVPTPRVETAPVEPIRRPPWPALGAGNEDRPDQLPEPAPPTASAVVPSQSSAPALPHVEPAPTILAPEAYTSLKVTEPAAGVKAASLPPNANETLLIRALRSFQNNRPQEALEHLKHLDTTNQELLMYLMPLMVRLSEGNANSLPPEELAVVIDRLQNASSMLKSKATLRADRVCFCRGVRKFADLDSYEPGHEFHVGDMVFLYAELKNFTCEPAAAQTKAGYNAPTRGCYIRLGTTLELRDLRDNLVWRTDLHKNDYAQTPPQDYYHTYRFCVPDKLPPGTYTLWLNIVDKPTGRSIRKPIEMRIGQD